MRPEEFLAPDGDKESVTKARIYLGSMKYTTDEMSHPVSDLSGGQRAKLLLLKAILDRSNVLLLDEPTRNFSPLSCPAVRKLLSEFPGCILAVSHDRKFIEEVTPTLYTLTATGLQRIYR
jgi:ATPase subunit of ABC transporter with duplicated ATPase domains